jgi:hypothetical protein
MHSKICTGRISDIFTPKGIKSMNKGKECRKLTEFKIRITALLANQLIEKENVTFPFSVSGVFNILIA